MEASYGFGMSTSDAKTLLAGGERFGIDDIEVWLIGHSSELGGGYSDYQQQGGASQYGGNYDYEDQANVGNATPGTMPEPPATDIDMGDWRPPEPPQQQ